MYSPIGKCNSHISVCNLSVYFPFFNKIRTRGIVTSWPTVLILNLVAFARGGRFTTYHCDVTCRGSVLCYCNHCSSYFQVFLEIYELKNVRKRETWPGEFSMTERIS